MKGAGCDEQNVVGLHRAVFGGDRGALDQRQQVALHAFPADVRALALGPGADLVELVEKDDAVLLHHVDRLAHDLLFVDQLVAFFVEQYFVGIRYRHAARLGAAAEGFSQHVVQVDHTHLGAGSAGNIEGRQTHRSRVRHFEFDFLVVEFAVAQLLFEGVARCFARIFTDQGVDDPFFGHDFSLCQDVLAVLFADHVDGGLDEIADDLFHVAADVADLGKFCRLDLDERRLIEFREPAGNLCLADAGRADHQNILRQDFLAQLFRQLLAAPAVAQRHRDGAFGILLTDDVTVELGDDFAGTERGHTISSTTSSLV